MTPEVGDTVTLLDGGPPMQVEKVDIGFTSAWVTCWWWDNADVQRQRFLPQQLKIKETTK